MTLTTGQKAKAVRLQERGLLLREIAAELDVTFEDVCLALYGNNDWRPRIGAEQISGGEDGGVDAADARRDAAGDGRQDGPRAGDAGAATGTLPPATDPAVPAAPEAAAGADSGAEPPEAPAAAAAPRPAAEPVAAPAPESHAPDAAPVVVGGLEPEPLRGAAPRVPAAALTDPAPVDDGRLYRLVEFDGQSLHEHRRGLTRLPKFWWTGTAADVARLKRMMPQWQDLEPVEIGR